MKTLFKLLYKLFKGLVVLALIVIIACCALKRTNVDCGDFQRFVNVVANMILPGHGTDPVPEEELLEKLNALIKQNQSELAEANKSIEEIAKKIDEWRKEIEGGETFADLLCGAINANDYPTKVLDQTFDSEEDVKGTLESILSQLEARQASVDDMKSMMRDAEKCRDELKKQIAELEAKVAKVKTALAQRKQDEREEIDVEAELQKIEDGADGVESVFGVTDLSSLSARIAREEEKIKKAGEKQLEEEQRVKQFDEYYVKYQVRSKAKDRKSDSRTRNDFEKSSKDKED